MTPSIFICSPQYGLLQEILREGPIDFPREGERHDSAEALLEQGFLRMVEGDLGLTLRGAVAVVAGEQQPAENGVVVAQFLLDACHDG